jgi:tRNA-Thr(GGU) m(6)t(6)A37 methyltransferase TsaA
MAVTDQQDRQAQVFSLTPIGYVDRGEDGAGQDLSIEELRVQRVRIVLNEQYLPGLLTMEAGLDILVLCYLDRASRDVLQVYPRGDRTRPLRGVFTTRSPARPNPISVTSARVLSVDGPVIEVVGLDVLHHTPVIDIKDHAPYFDTPYDEDLDAA